MRSATTEWVLRQLDRGLISAGLASDLLGVGLPDICGVVQGDGSMCRRPYEAYVHEPAPFPGVSWHHEFRPIFEEETMPKPTVTIATVLDTYSPAGDDPAAPYFTVTGQRGDPMPRVGDRVAVAGSVDAIFGWMDSLPAKRVVDAAREWAAQVDRFRGVTQREDMGTAARQLYDAVKALGAPSEDEKPKHLEGVMPEDCPGCRAKDERERRAKDERERARVFIVDVGPEDEWLLRTGDRLILSPAGDVSVVIAREAR